MSNNHRLRPVAIAAAVAGAVLTTFSGISHLDSDQTASAKPPTAVAVTEAASVSVAAPESFDATYPLGDAVPDVITSDGYDQYLHEHGDTFGVASAEHNTGANLRVIYSSPGISSFDQQVCATWDGPFDSLIQPGIVLRHRNDNGRVRAVTVTNNIWGGYRGLWNVHSWDTDMDASVPGTALAAIFTSEFDHGVHRALPAGPWRMCAKAEGQMLSFKVWPVSDMEPSWGDERYGGTVELGDNDMVPGAPGIYFGHLLPGETTEMSNVEVWDLDETS